MGHAHGTTYADEIRHYTEERLNLVTLGLWSGGPMGRADVLDLAASMLASHELHSPSLYAEMVSMAAAAGISPAQAVIVGGFTDFVDTVRAVVGGPHPETVIDDDCTAVLVGDHRADGAGYLAQTWDMHHTATEHVVVLRTNPDNAPAAIAFSTTGALGQIGMNELGVSVGINNLTAADGTLGVTWPQVVRHALEQESANDARDAILEADLAGGHNFLVFDADGVGYNIEAMPSARAVTPLNDAALAHTNHTLSAETSAVQGPRGETIQESSEQRLAAAQTWLERDRISETDLMAFTQDTDAICRVAVEPYYIESAGAAIMRPRTKDFWAVWGLPSMNDFQVITFAR